MFSNSFSAHLLHSKNIASRRGTKIGNPCIDGVFQYALNDSLIASNFLNTVLDLRGGARITNVVFLPRDLPALDPLANTGYNFTVDARCKTKDGRYFLVEMQNDFRDDYHLKALIEHSRMIGRIDLEQTKALRTDTEDDRRAKSNARKFWQGIQGIYSVILTNKMFSAQRLKKRYHEPIMETDLRNVYELRNIAHLDRHYGDIPNQIILLMLANLPEKPEKDFSQLERWAYMFQDKSLKYGARKIEEVKEIKDPQAIAGGNKAIEQFIQRLDINYLPQETLDCYHRAIQYYNDSMLDMEMRGEARGKIQGEKDAKIKIAHGMLAKNMDVKLIAELTGLTIDEIKAIK